MSHAAIIEGQWKNDKDVIKNGMRSEAKDSAG